VERVTIDSDLLAGDLGRIVEQHGRVYRTEHGFDQRFEGYVAAGLAEAVLSKDPPGTRFWIVRRADEFLGSAAVCPARATAGQFRWFLLEPSARGLGLGRRLLEDAIEHSAHAGFEQVFLWTVTGLDASARLYRDVGFVETERRPPAAPWGVTVTETRWELALGGRVGSSTAA
jgi:GNAT superfamily N-acetyltransferase